MLTGLTAKRSLLRGFKLIQTIVLGLFFFGCSLGLVRADDNTNEYNCNVAARGEHNVLLDCTPGYPTEHDQLRIVGAVPAGWPERESGIVLLPDITVGALIFDVGADETANLVVLFSTSADGAAHAAIYDDRDGDGRVSLETDLDSVQVRENGPVVEMIAPDGWWQRDGSRSRRPVRRR